ncbi:MAG: ABC transporter substrate-binding protein [Acidimicrobiia bacterium]|nr:ABC transporter substrate-binding protein [Acidimicrobiia bacterium]
MRTRVLGCGALVLGLIGVTACSSDGTDDSASTTAQTATTAAPASTAAPATTAGDGPADQPTSMEGWEALWAEERAAVVARIQENGWGVKEDGSQLVGPGGFTIDLARCPASWSDTEGMTDTEVKIGYPVAQSGPNAEAGGIGRAHDALFRHYNEQGVYTDVNDKTRQVRMLLRDDAYDPARTIPLVDELIDSEKVFAVETLGTPSTLRTYDKLNERCIPQPLVASGHPAFGDPVNHPWTTASSISYSTEAVIWGVFVEQHLDELGGKAKVASLRMNNDFGASYHAALEAYFADSPRKDDIEYVSESFEPAAATLKDEMTTLAAEDPDVFIGMSTGSTCTQFVTESALNGMKESVDYKFMSSACKATGPVTRDVVGEDSDGWWSVGGGLKDALTEEYDDDPFIVAAREFIDEAGYELTPSYNLGLYYSWALSQALQIAGQLDGGLTRTNLILALRSLEMTHPMLLPGITFNMDGNEDAYLVEGSDVSYWDAEQQTWVQDSIADLPGRTPLCAWDQAGSRCG